MRKRLVPALMLFLALMLDTTVLPMFIHGTWFVPVSLSIVICVGAAMGRYMGLVSGLAAGLLIDVLVGYPLGLRLFQYMGAGFLSGIIVPLPETTLERRGWDNRILMLRLGLFTMGYQLVWETAVSVYQYFHTARFGWPQATDALVRVAVAIVVTLALLLPLMKLSLGSIHVGGEEKRPKEEARLF